jgi:hypothetical protein
VRYIGPSRSKGVGPMYLALNRNKRSIALDLRKPEALAALQRLIEAPTCCCSTCGPPRWHA